MYNPFTLLKMTVFWVVAPCSLVEVYQRTHRPDDGGSKDLWNVGKLLTHRPDDGGSKDLWNVGKLLPDYTVLQPRRQSSSYSLPWEPQILHSHCCLTDFALFNDTFPVALVIQCVHKVPIYLQDHIWVQVMKITPHMLTNVFCDATERFVLCQDTDSVHVECNA
jgi:hypothetical protein